MSDQQQMAQVPTPPQQMLVVQNPPPQQMLVVQCPPPQQMSVVQCPPSLDLEPLAGLESVWIHQQVDLGETFSPVGIKNKYQITDHRGAQCYMAIDQPDVSERNGNEATRPYKIYIVDNYGRMVFYFGRPNAFTENRVTVHLHDGTILGSILPTCDCCFTSEFHVFDQNSSQIFRIVGPCCSWGCTCLSARLSNKHDVVDVKSKKPVAQIRKEFSGFLKEITTDADIFGVEFLIALDAKIKAVLIGAVFLIDFTYYKGRA